MLYRVPTLSKQNSIGRDSLLTTQGGSSLGLEGALLLFRCDACVTFATAVSIMISQQISLVSLVLQSLIDFVKLYFVNNILAMILKFCILQN